jgi:hypothetical protein
MYDEEGVWCWEHKQVILDADLAEYNLSICQVLNITLPYKPRSAK